METSISKGIQKDGYDGADFVSLETKFSVLTASTHPATVRAYEFPAPTFHSFYIQTAMSCNRQRGHQVCLGAGKPAKTSKQARLHRAR